MTRKEHRHLKRLGLSDAEIADAAFWVGGPWYLFHMEQKKEQKNATRQ
jgi:hypothetical protein